MEQSQLKELIQKIDIIITELQRLQERDDSLWDIGDIAHYIKAKRRSAERIIKHRYFPDPIRLPTTEDGGHPRWVAGEVKKFCLRFKY